MLIVLTYITDSVALLQSMKPNFPAISDITFKEGFFHIKPVFLIDDIQGGKTDTLVLKKIYIYIHTNIHTYKLLEL